MISVEDDVWQQYVKVHTQVKTLRFRSFRYFQDWVEIFGKDRATGKNAQGPEDLAKAATHEPYIPHFYVDEFPFNHNVDIQNDSQTNQNEQVHDDVSHNRVPTEEEIADTSSPNECNSVNINKKILKYEVPP